jgi:rhodanese-related sulfurtransferase
MKQLLLAALIISTVVTGVSSYDKDQAKFFNTFFSTFTDKEVGKEMKSLCPKDLIKRVKLGEEFFILDIRTEAETKFAGVTMKNTVTIPMHKVFEEKSLKQIPTDKNIVVVCAKGSRAVAIAMALRQIGFTRTYVLSGGIGKLATVLCPSCAK